MSEVSRNPFYKMSQYIELDFLKMILCPKYFLYTNIIIINKMIFWFQFLEFSTVKLDLPFAARRVFLENGEEVFQGKDIPHDGEVYISMGERFKDPYQATKSL